MTKTEPKILSGFMELLPKDQILFNDIMDTIKSTYENFGFLPLDTPIIEYSEVLLAKAGGETEKQIYRFNKGENDLSLRFDLTVPLARYVAMYYNDLVFPFKRYQIGKVYRGERPQKGRYREFYQCDIDIIGNETLDLIYDAEIPSVIYNIFKKLDFGKFVIRVNNRKILNGFFTSLDLQDKITDILRVVDKIDKIGIDEIKNELISLDINNNSMNLDINNDSVNKILEFIQISGSNNEIIKSLRNLKVTNEEFNNGINELEYVIANMIKFGVDNAQVDLTIARGLDYYTGTVYETKMVDYPELGSVCSGGRYDNLAEYYTDQKLPGVGVSIGLTRLFSKLKEMELIKNSKNTIANVLVIPMNENLEYSIKVTNLLRENNISTDAYLANKNFKNKMKYADRSGIRYAIIIGTDEEANNEVSVKDMISGEQQKVKLEELVKFFK